MHVVCVDNMIILTRAKMVAISFECPNGSICQATRGLASSPNVSLTNFNPRRISCTCVNACVNIGDNKYYYSKVRIQGVQYKRT